MENNYRFSCNAGCVIGNDIYAIDNGTGILFQYSIPSLKYSIVSYALKNAFPYVTKISGIGYFKESLFFIERYGNSIYELNISTDCVTKHECDLNISYEIQNRTMVLQDGVIFIMPMKVSAPILVFDIMKREFLDPISIPSNTDGALIGVHVKEKQIWFCERKSHNAFVLNIDLRTISACSISKDLLIDNVGAGLNQLLISDYSFDSVYKLTGTTIEKIIDIDEFEAIGDKCRIASFVEFEKGYVFVPSFGNKIIIVKKNNLSKDAVEIPKDADNTKGSLFTLDYFKISNLAVFLPRTNHYFFTVNEDLNINFYSSALDEADYESILSGVAHNGIVAERILTLENYLRLQ